MRSLHIDFETRSPTDIRRAGAYVYFDDPATDVWCAAYAFDDEPVQLWVPGEPCPSDIEKHILSGGRMVAHNAAFERQAFAKVLGPKYDWPVPSTRQWYCTMAMALAQALPPALEDACAVTQTPIQKDQRGARVMKQMAKPRRPRKGEPTDKLLWWDDADRLKILYEYCATDVEAERQLEKRLRPLSAFEQELWWLDQKINDRGVYVDLDLVNAALKIVDEQHERLDRAMLAITRGEVCGVGAVNQIKCYLRDFENLDVGESLAKDTIAELLIRSDISDTARKVLELRREGSKTSVRKVDALVNGRQSDGRVRGLLQYHAASTGRWGGRRFQPQNIKRPVIGDVDTAIALVSTGDLDLVEAMYGDVLGAIGDCLRGMVTAAPGRKLIAADYSNIEGRVLAWLAEEQWKVEAFEQFDAGLGPDLYKLAYARAFSMEPNAVDKNQRQIGKVMELALGYQGGVGAFEAMAAGYGVKVGEQWEDLAVAAEESVLDRVEKGWIQRGKSSGIGKATWSAAELLKVLWRDAHPNVVSLWRSMEDAAIETIKTGERHRVGRMAFEKRGSFLVMELPSGRLLYYAFPKIVSVPTPWKNADGETVYKDQIQFKAVDSMTRQWGVQSTYGGSLVENACQAVARDVLAEAMMRVEPEGYRTVLTVHDEMVVEVPEDFGSAEQLERLMAQRPDWADGLPLTAEGWEGRRYRK